MTSKRVSSALAFAEFGYDPRSSVDEAVRAMVAGLIAEGRLPAARGS